MIYQPSLFAHINSRYHAFKAEALKDSHIETAQFWARYMYIIQMVLTLIMATRKTTLNCMSALSVCLVPNVIAHNHNNYAQYVPALLITLISLSDTHPRCKELLKQNGFSVSQSLVLCLRNAFDIATCIRQTINPVPKEVLYALAARTTLRTTDEMVYYLSHQSSIY